MLCCLSLRIIRYITDLVKMSQTWLMCTKVGVTMTGVIMEGSVSFFLTCLCVEPLNIRFKKKVKVTLVQALRLCTGRTAHRGSRGIGLLYRH
jgi:hypothetical protein